MTLPSAKETFALGTTAEITAWHENLVHTKASPGPVYRTVLTLRDVYTGHGMIGPVEALHSEWSDHNERDLRPLAVGMRGRWMSHRGRNRVSMYFARRPVDSL